MQPWLMLRSGLGTMSSSANWRLKPRPSQAGQAPKGELKEKERGSRSGMPMPKRWHLALLQASLLEKSRSLPPRSTRAEPSARLQAISRLSARRVLMPSAFLRRSMTTSMVCFFCLSRSGTPSVRSSIAPLTRARM